MCIICVEIQLGRASFKEALDAFEELRSIIDPAHLPEVQKAMKELNAREHDPSEPSSNQDKTSLPSDRLRDS